MMFAGLIVIIVSTAFFVMLALSFLAIVAFIVGPLLLIKGSIGAADTPTAWRRDSAHTAQAYSTMIWALVTEMNADPGGLVTRGWLALRPALIEMETEIVVLSTS